MKDWFPLTSYDFYAYLTAGMVLLAAIDRVFLGSMLAGRDEWTVVAGVFWAAVAYLFGQIVAIPSSALFEHLVARRLLRPPAALLLGLVSPRRVERVVAAVFGAREYQPFPAALQASILAKAGRALGCVPTAVEGEAAFQVAFPYARSVADTAVRLDTFLNQYGMCRNVSFASLVAAALLAPRTLSSSDRLDILLFAAALVLAAGLFGRYIKFYAAYAREVLRTFDKVAGQNMTEARTGS